MKYSPCFWMFSEPQSITIFPLHIKPWALASGRGSSPRMTVQRVCSVIIPPNETEEGQQPLSRPLSFLIDLYFHRVPSWQHPLPPRQLHCSHWPGASSFQ